MARATFSTLIIICLTIAYTTGYVSADTYVFDGTARSQVSIAQTTTISVSGLDPSTIPNGSKVLYNASYPSSSNVNGYFISSSNVQIDADPAPSSISGIMTDKYGNKYKQLVWNIDRNTSPSFGIVVTTRFNADIKGDLSPLSYEDTIGTSAYPEYRAPTDMVQSNAPAIVNKKNVLLSGVTSQAEAVDRIMNFVKTSIPDTDPDVPKDALSSLGSSKGNCVNRAHLALALLRSAGIPARCVQGLVYGDDYSVSYSVDGGKGSTKITWGDGPHVWVEVYYPDEGAWVAYDPFMDKGFVDSRHVKLSVGKDDNPDDAATRGDVGRIYVDGASPSVTFSSEVSASGLQDSISLRHKYTKKSPQNTFMIARELRSSLAPTLTPTPKPNNTTVTPTPVATRVATPGPSIVPGDNARHNVTGTIVDASTGASVQGATVLLDTVEISASQSGRFAFLYAVTNGSYVLSVSAPGYMTEKQVLMPNNADIDVRVKLVSLSGPASPTPTAKPSPAPGVMAALAALAGGMLLRRGRAL
jgi:transglutaminase-like putative cysteine protease